MEINKKAISGSNDTVITYYVRDAQGKVMATYEQRKGGNGNEFVLKEQHLYGSSRLGMRQTDILLATHTGANDMDLSYSTRTLGEKNFELTNHLGNVMAVISDKRILQPDGSYKADIQAAYDYFPFGMTMPGRTVNNSYRYGFNGQEKINEYSGIGEIYDLGSRIYNPLIGRQFTPDPREREYPWQSTYAYYANSPIWKIDYKGEGNIYNEKGECIGGDCYKGNGSYNNETGWTSNEPGILEKITDEVVDYAVGEVISETIDKGITYVFGKKAAKVVSTGGMIIEGIDKAKKGAEILENEASEADRQEAQEEQKANQKAYDLLSPSGETQSKTGPIFPKKGYPSAD